MIEQVIIENFRSIRHCALTLGRQNILIGSNGVGKSNLLSFFKLVNSIYNQRLGTYTMDHGGIENLLYFGRKQSKYIEGLLDFSNANAFFFKLTPNQTNKAYIEYAGNYFNAKGLDGKDYTKWDKMTWDGAVDELEISNKNSHAEYIKEYLDSFHVYHFHDTSETSAMKGLCNISDNTYLREDGSNLAAFLYFLSEKYPKEFKKIEGTVRSIAPYFERFDLKPERANEQYIQLEWKEKNSDMYLNAYNFSDGTIRFIALATLLMQPVPPPVILIDEPELGLHPAAINKLAALVRMASHKSQIIVSTQSPNFVDCFDPSDIITVDREDGQSVFKRLDEGKLEEWLKDYSIGDLWEKNVIGGQL